MNNRDVVALIVDMPDAVQAEIKTLKAQIGDVEAKMTDYFKELGLDE